MLPEIVVFGIKFPTYIVYLSVLFSGLVVWVPRYAQRQGLSVSIAMNLALILMVSGMIGARLFHVFFESYAFYRVNFARVLYIWNGGFVFFGGAIFAALCALGYLSIRRIPLRPWLDFWCVVVALGYGLGRVSCLLAGCCYGVACDLPWAIEGRHPTQAYAVLWELAVFAVLWKLRTPLKSAPGSLFSLWLILHGIGRLIMEHYRADFRGTMMWNLSVSSWIALFLVAIGVGMFLYCQESKRAPSPE